MPTLVDVEATADAGVYGLSHRPVGRLTGMGDFHPDAPARTKAGIEHTPPIQLGERLIVQLHAIRLPHHRTVPVEAEPPQIVADAPLELRPAALAIDVLHTQEEAAADRPRRLPRDQGRVGVA